MVWEGKRCFEEFDLHVDICSNLGLGFLATDYMYMSFLQSPDTQCKNMRPNRLSHIYTSIV